MKTTFTARTSWCLIIGFILQVAPIVFATRMAGQPVSEVAKAIVIVVRLAGMATFMTGVGFLAQNKGRTGFLGAFGILSLVGLGIVMAIPPAKKNDEKQA